MGVFPANEYDSRYYYLELKLGKETEDGFTSPDSVFEIQASPRSKTIRREAELPSFRSDESHSRRTPMANAPAAADFCRAERFLRKICEFFRKISRNSLTIGGVRAILE